LAAVEKSCFIISSSVCENLLSFTIPLSHYLQSPKRDFSSAVDYAKHIIIWLKLMRQNSNELFTQIFQEANKLSKMYFDTEIKIPRNKNKQNYTVKPGDLELGGDLEQLCYFLITTFNFIVNKGNKILPPQ
jgi:hypothetical protein